MTSYPESRWQCGTLEGHSIRLEPLSRDHVPGLRRFALDPELWRWTTDRVLTADDLDDYVERALRERDGGSALPFATVLQDGGVVVGCTRFGALSRMHRRAEIGWTFVGRAWQRTPVNTEAKYLMLRWAFEDQALVRVELKTDVLNVTSRRAIERVGAVQEGILRKHMQCPAAGGGRTRDTVYYSIVDEEWPERRSELERKLGRS